VEAVGCSEAGRRRARLELIATPSRHCARAWSHRRWCEAETLRVVAADDHGEGVFKAQRRFHADVIARGVERADGGEDAGRMCVLSGCLRMAVSGCRCNST